jgi:hypothetical protein
VCGLNRRIDGAQPLLSRQQAAGSCANPRPVAPALAWYVPPEGLRARPNLLDGPHRPVLHLRVQLHRAHQVSLLPHQPAQVALVAADP